MQIPKVFACYELECILTCLHTIILILYNKVMKLSYLVFNILYIDMLYLSYKIKQQVSLTWKCDLIEEIGLQKSQPVITSHDLIFFYFIDQCNEINQQVNNRHWIQSACV